MTSIEWLIDQLQKGRATFFKINENEERIITLVGEDVVNQAKEMHKQEIIDAVGVGSQFDRGYLYGYHDKAEQYYQETFVSKGSDTLKDYHPVDTNKMIDHIGEVNEMVEDDVEKLAEEEFSDNQLKDMYSYEDAIRFRGKLSYARKGFVKGYNKAKETLYTEEQVGRAIDMARKDWNLKYEIIQSLKQPKQ